MERKSYSFVVVGLFLGTRHRRRPTRLALLTRHVVERTAVQAGRTPTALPRAFAVTAYGR